MWTMDPVLDRVEGPCVNEVWIWLIVIILCDGANMFMSGWDGNVNVFIRDAYIYISGGHGHEMNKAYGLCQISWLDSVSLADLFLRCDRLIWSCVCLFVSFTDRPVSDQWRLYRTTHKLRVAEKTGEALNSLCGFVQVIPRIVKRPTISIRRVYACLGYYYKTSPVLRVLHTETSFLGVWVLSGRIKPFIVMRIWAQNEFC